MSNLFWLTDEQMARLQPYFPKSHGRLDGSVVLAVGSTTGGHWPLLPRNKGGARRVDDRRVISGIIHVLTDVIGRPFAFMLTGGNAADSPVAPHLLAGLKGARYLLADKGYDANSLRKRLRQSAIVPVIPGRSNRKRPIRYDAERYKSRHLIENAFCLKDFRRIATRYDKLARNFLSAVALATLVAFWL